MKKKFLKALAVIMVYAAIWAMSGVRANGQDSTQNNNVEFKTEHFSWTVAENEWGNQNDLEIDYPVSGGQPLLDSVRTWINSRLKKFLGGDLYEGPLDDGQALFDFYTEPRGYDFQFSIGIGRASEKFVICFANYYVDYGGAHGGYGNYSATFRRDNGKILGWDIFKENSLNNLCLLVEEALNRDYFAEIDDGSGLTNGKNMWGDKLELPRNMPKFTEKGIVFEYNEYEIAPWFYHAPAPWCFIPYEDLIPYMTEEAKRLFK